MSGYGINKRPIKNQPAVSNDSELSLESPIAVIASCRFGLGF